MTNRTRLGAIAGLGLTIVACDMAPTGPKEAEVGVAGDQRRVDPQTPARGLELQEDRQTAPPPVGGDAARRPPQPGQVVGNGPTAATAWPSFGATGRLPPADTAGAPRPR